MSPMAEHDSISRYHSSTRHQENSGPPQTLPRLRHLGLPSFEEFSSFQEPQHLELNRKGKSQIRQEQNRHAQRASRQRRAARAMDLEEQLQRQDEEHEEGQREMNETINQLELELESAKAKSKLLEEMLERERKDRLEVEKQIGAMAVPRHISPQSSCRSRSGSENRPSRESSDSG
ncbi:unnamed protein product [Clonostachys rhizophaga]|uniref:BZIP domain-containing protein n=1 Tax=Clonostachys rhizophaga TaxID=160324 RepID=A0A9N9VQ15_9HYPO|nr:unnamed protein product [Clonostachys rhizophaga]